MASAPQLVSTAPAVLVNPAPAELGKRNAILSARGRRHYVREFPGPLSIKTVVRGSAVWQTAAGRFELGPSRFLILNDGSPYSLTVESPRPVETFCIFFQKGFVEGARDAVGRPAAWLIDNPFEQAREPIGFFERLHDSHPRLSARFEAMRLAVAGAATTPEWTPEWLEQQLVAMAFDLVALRGDVGREAEGLAAQKGATRAEIYRRLIRGRQFLDESYGEPVRLADAAKAACLSTFHFHRMFHQAFRETPHAYLMRRRLTRAADLLAHSERPVHEICGLVGYQSLGAFSSLFRRRFGVPPRAYRALGK